MFDCERNSCSDISKEVKAALRSMEKAEELGLESDRVQVNSLWKLHDTSLKEILNVLGGWRARSPSEFAAEFFQMGTQKTLLLNKILMNRLRIKAY